MSMIWWEGVAGITLTPDPLVFKLRLPTFLPVIELEPDPLVFALRFPDPTIGMTPIVVTDPTPDLVWRYFSPGGHPQAAYRAALWEAATGAVLLDTGITAGTASSVRVPIHTLDTAKSYRWTVTAWDDQGLRGDMAVAGFDTSFTVPPTPTGLTLEARPDISAVELTWAASTLLSDEFYRWAVYRRNDPDAGYVLIAELLDPTTITFTDYGAALRDNVAYRLTQDNGWAESDSADASAELTPVTPGSWVVVVPGEARFLLELVIVAEGTHQANQPAERYVPLDRAIPIVETGPLSGITRSLVVGLLPDERFIEGRLREIADWPSPAIFKNPYGDAWTVRLGDVTTGPGGSDLPPGSLQVTVAYQQVDAVAASAAGTKWGTTGIPPGEVPVILP